MCSLRGEEQLDLERFGSPFETCAQSVAPSRKASLACEAGYRGVFNQLVHELRDLGMVVADQSAHASKAVPASVVEVERPHSASVPSSILDALVTPIVDDDAAVTLPTAEDVPYASVELTIPFRDESSASNSWVQAMVVDVPIPRGAPMNASMHDAASLFCRQNAHFGQSCTRLVLAATHFDRSYDRSPGDIRERKQPPDPRKTEFFVDHSAPQLVGR